MLRLFKTDTIINYLILAFVLVALRIASVSNLGPLPVEEGGYGYVMMLQWVGIDTIWIKVIGIVALFIQSIAINSISLKNQFFQDRITYPAFYYVLLHSTALVFMPTSAIVMGLLFVSFALSNFFSIQQQSEASSAQFNIGFFVCFAWLFYQPFVWILFYLMVRLLAIKQVKLADIMQMITGWLAALFLSFVFAFLTDTLDLFKVLQLNETFTVIHAIELFSHGSLWIIVGIFMLAILIAVAQYSNLTYKVSLPNKKKIGLVYEIVLVLSICMVFQSRLNIQDILIISPPLAIIIAGATYYIKNQLVKELIPLMIIGCLLFLQVYFGV